MNICLINARIVLEDEVLENASLMITDGEISAINPVSTADAKIIDLAGKLLMPGMIDLHCDALEKEVEPRPNVFFPLDFACAQADKRNAAAGITTVYHSLSFANDELGVRNNEMAASVARAVHEWHPHGLVDNRVHCRYEITDEFALPILKQLLKEQSMHLVSMMDHTPGQGQFKDLAAYRDYLTRNYKKTADEVDVIVERKVEAAAGAFERMQSFCG
jgi:alpha-D-ribose 1-methylphosphonate 5-triphosphate diphosphatase